MRYAIYASSVLMFLGGVVVIYLIKILWRKKDDIAVIWVILSAFLISIRAFLESITHLVQSPEIGRLIVFTIRPLGLFATVFILFFITEYSTGRPMKNRYIMSVSLIPIITQIFMWTRPEEFFLYVNTKQNGVVVWDYAGGVGLIHRLYIALLFVASFTILLRDIVETRNRHRKKQLLMLFAAMLVATVFSYTIAFEFIPPYLNPQIIGVVFSIGLLTYAIDKYGLFTTKVHRKDVIESISDGIITINSKENIVHANILASDIIGDTECIGEDISNFYPFNSVDNIMDLDGDEITSDGNEFKISIDNVTYGRELGGNVIVFKDITKIKKREEELSLVQEVFNRIFRHNIRNEMTVVTGHSEVIQSRSEDQTIINSAETIEDSSRKLAQHAEKARLIDQVINNKNEKIEQEVEEIVWRSISECREEYPDAQIDASIECEDVHIDAVRKSYEAISNAIENSIHHNEEVEVTVRCERKKKDKIAIIVEDNGSGIEESEIEVVKEGEETALQHGSGVGLWVMRWVTEVSDGDLEIEDTGNGTKVELIFQISDSQ